MNTYNFDLNLLRVFDAVAREQHVTRAAARLNLSQPAVSNALNRLRAALGRMDQALTKDDQVIALTEIIRAYEIGLAALRDGLRRASLRYVQRSSRYDMVLAGEHVAVFESAHRELRQTLDTP